MLLANVGHVTQRSEYRTRKSHVCWGWFGSDSHPIGFAGAEEKLWIALHITARNANMEWLWKIRMQQKAFMKQLEKQNSSSCQSLKRLFQLYWFSFILLQYKESRALRQKVQEEKRWQKLIQIWWAVVACSYHAGLSHFSSNSHTFFFHK